MVLAGFPSPSPREAFLLTSFFLPSFSQTNCAFTEICLTQCCKRRFLTAQTAGAAAASVLPSAAHPIKLPFSTAAFTSKQVYIKRCCSLAPSSSTWCGSSISRMFCSRRCFLQKMRNAFGKEMLQGLTPQSATFTTGQFRCNLKDPAFWPAYSFAAYRESKQKASRPEL